MIRNTIRMAMLAAAFIASLPAWADYETGQRAWDAGHLDEALTQWRAAADAGDRRAMLALGQRYRQGLGVLQDYVEAHMWFNLAASRGEAAALDERDVVAAKMTPAQIGAAQQRAAAWRPGAGPGGSAPATPTPSDAASASEEDSPPAAGDPRGTDTARGAGLSGRGARRHLGHTHRASLSGVPARCGASCGGHSDAGCASGVARACAAGRPRREGSRRCATSRRLASRGAGG